MYQNIFHSKKDNKIFLWDDTQGVVSFPYEQIRYAYKKKMGGKYRSIYGDELEKVINFNENDPTLFESDLNPLMRVLIDTYESSDEPSTGHRIVFTDIEVDSEGGFPNVSEGDKEITAISIYDDVSEKYTAYILDKNSIIQSDDFDKDVDLIACSDEEQLIRRFLNKWEEIGPTIVTGWNTNGFDIPYLFNRICRVMGKKEACRLSPINIVYINKFDNQPVIAGISCLDYLLLFKKFSGKNLPNNQLNTVGKMVVGMEKIHYDGNLNDLYKSDVKKYIEYNLHDVRIVVALDKKLKLIDLARRICHTGHVPYEWFGMSSRYLDGAIILYIRRNGGLIAPNKPARGYNDDSYEEDDDDEGRDKKFSGAYVKNPIPGRYDYVYDLDLTSMYPNIIISINISPETKAAKCYKVHYKPDAIEKRRKEVLKENAESDKPIKDVEKLEALVNKKLNEFDMEYHIRGEIESYDIGQTEYTKEEFVDLIEKSNYSLSSNGVMYSQDIRGIIPSILQKWFQERQDMRKLSKLCLESGDEEGYVFNDQRQKVWKILLNSMYGCMGLPVWRWYDIDNAESVTKTGVTIIKMSEKAIQQYYEKQLGDCYEIQYDDGSEELIYKNVRRILKNGQNAEDVVKSITP